MNSTVSPRPPKWPYLLGDALLLALACAIGLATERPLSPVALTAVFGCVAFGSILGALPFLLDFLAQQRAAAALLQQKLDLQGLKLQQAADTLAATSAQLKAAHEAAARAVHAADNLPYRLQEKVAEFTTQLQERDDEEKAAMAKELEALRDAEGQRLATLVHSIQTATKEFSAIEQAARTALEGARREATEAVPALAAALGAATTRAEAALGTAITRAESAIDQTTTRAQSALAATEAQAREAIASAEALANRLLERTAALRQLEQELDSSLQEKIAQLGTAARALETAAHTARHANPTAAKPPVAAEPPAESLPAAAPALPAALPVMQLSAFPRSKREAAPTAPEPAGATPLVTTVTAPEPTAEPAVAEPEPAGDTPTVAAEPPSKREPRRKSPPRSVGEAVLPGFAEPEIVYDAEPAAAHSAPAKTSDGSTRLLVTAYIGIGNKVFLRGEGPGLSREKGIPMEFISIGKWAWVCPDATAPVKIQLYKNDQLPAQGEPITIPVGHHVEATPVFREPDPF